jgi:hypothetical protein
MRISYLSCWGRTQRAVHYIAACQKMRDRVNKPAHVLFAIVGLFLPLIIVAALYPVDDNDYLNYVNIVNVSLHLQSTLWQNVTSSQ